MNSQDVLFVKQIWKDILELDRQEHRNNFLMNFKPRTAYHDYYSELTIESLIKDSMFLNYLYGVYSYRINLKKRGIQSVERGWKKIENLDHEPKENFTMLCERIKEKRKGI